MLEFIIIKPMVVNYLGFSFIFFIISRLDSGLAHSKYSTPVFVFSLIFVHLLQITMILKVQGLLFSQILDKVSGEAYIRSILTLQLLDCSSWILFTFVFWRPDFGCSDILLALRSLPEFVKATEFIGQSSGILPHTFQWINLLRWYSISFFVRHWIFPLRKMPSDCSCQ